MPKTPKPRLALTVLVVSSFAFAIAGCGEGKGSSNSGPAGVAPPGSVVYVEGALRPSGSQKSAVDSVAEAVAGVDDLGDLIVSELESSAREGGEPFDYEREVEPWLGQRGAVVFRRLVDGELSDPIVLVQSTDTEATQGFIDRQKGGGAEESVVGLVDGFLVIAADRRALESVVDASRGDSLADEERFERTISLASEGSFADAYVDVGSLLRQGDVEIDEQVEKGLEEAGVEPGEATAAVSVTPGSDRIEIEIRSELSETEAPEGSAPQLLAALPRDSFAALAFSGFGERLGEVLDEIDREGIPGEIPPGELKSGLQEAGIDLDAIAGALRDAGAFAVGESEGSLGGALVLTTEGSQATDAISGLGLLLRGANLPGLTALGDGLSGFSVRDPEELGPKPLVVATRGDRIAIGYGLPAARKALAGTGRTLADDPAYDDAVASLRGTPIVGFADGPASLRLADALIPPSDSDFETAKRFLRSVRFLALGSGSETDPATLKLVVGLEE